MNGVLFLDPRGTATEVVKAAKRQGWRTIALLSHPDLASAECRAYLERIEAIEDWNDTAAACQRAAALMDGFSRVGVYFNMDACAGVGSRLRQSFGLPCTPPDVMDLVLDKLRLRRLLREHGLSELLAIDDAEASKLTSWPFPGAAYFKPVHGVVSSFVTRVEGLAQLEAAAAGFRTDAGKDPEYVQRYLDRGGRRFYVEEACDGELLSLETITSGGEIQRLGLLSRILYSRNAVIEMGSCFPYPHPRAAAIADKLAAIHRAVGFTDGPAHNELIVTDDGRIELIDFNPRIVGADVLWSINFALGMALEEELLRWAVGEQVRVSAVVKGYSCLQYVLPPEALTFASLTLPEAPEVRYRRTFVSPGAQVASVDRQTDYLGCYLTFMPSFDAAVARSRALRADVRVNGTLPGSF